MKFNLLTNVKMQIAKTGLLLSFAFLIFNQYGFAQSQRLVLFEEFTQASCPPCAVANPIFDPFLNTNAAKAVSVKYHTYWPGVDPMNAQNASQSLTRVQYYSVNGVPDAKMDGVDGYPSSYTQTQLNNEYAVPSPFTINVTHWLSAAHDIIYVHADIACTQAVSGTLVAQMAVIERNVYYTTAPGSNGETHFPHVMKQMLPSDQGTPLPTSCSVGYSTTIDQQWTLANIADTNQLAVVMWIQDNGTQAVHQAGYSRPHIMNDAGITSISLSTLTCSATLSNIGLNLHNFTGNTLSSAIINYSVDGGSPQTFNWNGTIGADGDMAVTLPSLTFTNGAHTLHVWTSMPNGATDLDTHNDGITQKFNVLLTPAITPLVQPFTGLFPPTGYSIENVGSDTYTWIKANPGAIETGSTEMQCYYASSGTIDDFYTPLVDFSTAVAGSQLTFYVSHAQYVSSFSGTYKERLKVDVSINCGTTWTNVYNKLDPALATTTSDTNSYAPTALSQWRMETIPLSQFNGSSNMLVRFQSTSNYGNNIFIDDINITNGTTNTENLLSSRAISLYPNPTTGKAVLKINFDQPKDITVTVSNLLGATINTFTVKDASGLYTIDLSGQPEGSYFVNIKSDNETVTKRIFVTK